jgi:hypothetical protein
MNKLMKPLKCVSACWRRRRNPLLSKRDRMSFHSHLKRIICSHRHHGITTMGSDCRLPCAQFQAVRLRSTHFPVYKEIDRMVFHRVYWLPDMSHSDFLACLVEKALAHQIAVADNIQSTLSLAVNGRFLNNLALLDDETADRVLGAVKVASISEAYFLEISPELTAPFVAFAMFSHQSTQSKMLPFFREKI